MKNINLIQYTIYEYEKKDISSDSALWKTGVLKIGQEDGIQWEDFESKTGDVYYRLNLPFEFNQNRGYLITFALYNTDYSIVYAVFSKKFFKEFYSIPFDYYYLFS